MYCAPRSDEAGDETRARHERERFPSSHFAALGDAEIFLRFRAQNRDSLLCQDFFIFTQTRTLALIGATRVSSITKNDVSFPKRARVHNLRHRPR